ncbi:MAG: ABC transporter substrate-binding protein [Alphaproteobacteria bacterium]|nr:ABC transporter substrate-binding protein [Alphaproteobacteria bacterium]
MKKLLSLVALVSFVSVGCGISDLEAWTIRMTCRSKGREIELCKQAIDEWVRMHKGKHKVEIVTLPHASNECFALYQQWLSAETFDVDIMQMDVAWIGVFSDYLFSLDEVYQPEHIDTEDYFDAVKESMYSHDGRLIALPWYSDCGIMYYRKDLLRKYDRNIPETWEELYDTALYIQNEERQNPEKRAKFHGFIFQAKAFEILTCNFLEFVDSFGGAIVHEKKAVVDSDASLNATMFMIKCIKNITNHNVLNYSEEDARGVFQSGNAVFMRNWPYAWALVNDPSTSIAGKVGIMPIPRSKNGGKNSGNLGGWFLVVSRFSKHPDVAADLIRFLTNKAQQKYRAKYSYLPTFKSLYHDDDILRENPFFADVYDSLNNAVVRPSIVFGKNYSRASSEIYNAVNTILTRSTESELTESEVRNLLNRLNKKLMRLLEKTNKPAQQEENKEKDNSSGFFGKIKGFFGIKS